MTVIRTNSSITPPINSTTLLAGLETAMQNAGFGTKIHRYVVGNETRDVYRVQFSPDTYGTAYFITAVTNNLSIGCSLHYDFNTSTNTGSSLPANSYTNMTVQNGAGVNFVAFNGGTQFKMVLIIQGVAVGALSLVRPSLARPNFWTDNQYPYFFMGSYITGSNKFTTWAATGGASLHPYSYTEVGLRPINLQGSLPDGKRQVVCSVQLQSIAGPRGGFIGQFDSDIAQVSGQNTNMLDLIIVEPGVEEYTILDPVSGGLAVRTV